MRLGKRTMQGQLSGTLTQIDTGKARQYHPPEAPLVKYFHLPRTDLESEFICDQKHQNTALEEI
jgi:hypothetical protein